MAGVRGFPGGTKPRNAYHFRDQWFVEAPVEAVWPIIRDVSTYSRWWRDFAETRRRNDIDGVGAVVWIHAKSALPYHMYFEVEAISEKPPHLAAVQVRGDLNGEMVWKLSSEAGGTRLVFEETVTTGKTLLTVLAPLLKPLFAWNHAIMMRNGERGLRRLLVPDPIGDR